jgi:hypothetical protein
MFEETMREEKAKGWIEEASVVWRYSDDLVTFIAVNPYCAVQEDAPDAESGDN